MARLRVHGFSVSLDGFGAGPNQDRDHPLGVGGEALHEWIFATEEFREAFGTEGGDDEPDPVNDAFQAEQRENIGATIMGRNMFGPVRGPWPDEEWRGWWGQNPPYHHDVFVLTHHPRAPLSMDGGTTFHFVSDGAEAVAKQAIEAAGGADVLVGGGVATIQQFLRAGLIEEMNLVMVPVLLHQGERLYDNSAAARSGTGAPSWWRGRSVVHARFTRT